MLTSLKTHRPAIMGTHFMVASNHYLASLAGVRILERGGNAIDAGVAAGLCINVLEFHVAQFGGVAPIMVYLKQTGDIETISGLGRWPRQASIEYYQEKVDGDMPPGVLRSITPASPDAWITALDRYGTMSFSEVAEPALDLAENGFPMYPRLQRFMTSVAERVSRWPSNRQVYLPGGRIPQVGERFVQKDLANTLKRMKAEEKQSASQGRHAGLMTARDLLYKGEMAETIVDFCQQEGGLLTLADLAEFRSKVEPPEKVKYKDYEVYSCGAWCQGPMLLQALKLLEDIDLVSLGHNTPLYLHTLAEAFKLACADREKYYGDPEFVRVPMKGLLSKEYADERRSCIDLERACPEMPPFGNPWRYQDGEAGAETKAANSKVPAQSAAFEADTSYVCVVDAQGNAFSATPSDATFDTPIVPGLGFSISSRGQQSWLDPHHASSMQPGKRPRLTPNPALVMKDGKLFMPFGCPGGDRQTQAMAQVFVNMVEFGMNPQEAIEAPRIWSESFPDSFWPHIYRPGRLCVEGRFPEPVRDALAAKGHKIQMELDWAPRAAGVSAILVNHETGTLTGGADPRFDAYAIGW